MKTLKEKLQWRMHLVETHIIAMDKMLVANRGEDYASDPYSDLEDHLYTVMRAVEAMVSAVEDAPDEARDITNLDIAKVYAIKP